jgi:hypothetical protein
MTLNSYLGLQALKPDSAVLNNKLNGKRLNGILSAFWGKYGF